MIIFGRDAFYECVLWSYWGTPKAMNITVRLAIPPQEGDDIIVDGQTYSVMARRIEHQKPIRLYVSLDGDTHHTEVEEDHRVT